MNEQSALFIKNCFRNFYQNNKPDPPNRMHEREWAFVAFDRPGMFRHLSLDRDTLSMFLVSRVPRHVYYSAARWQTPGAKDMDQMGWLGADMIFDIDFKYDDITHAEALELAKQEILKLIDCLRNDLGFHDLEIVFSGRKGYHCHVIDESLVSLNNKERREILDYITGNNCLPVANFRQLGQDHIVILPKEDSIGRAGRFRATLAHCISESIRENNNAELSRNLIKIKGIGNKRANAIYNSIISNKGINNAIRCDSYTFECWKILFDHIQSLSDVKIDQQVTVNVRHVIRLPDTIHGDTGLKVMRVKDLDSFDPLTDAVCLSDRLINVIIRHPTKMEISGHSYRLKEGEAKVPEFLAVYSICHSTAEIAV